MLLRLGHIVTQAAEALKAALAKSTSASEKALAKKERFIAAKRKPKPKLTPEELKAFRVELMAKACAAKKV